MTNKEIILSGVHMDLTEALKSMVREKVEKLFRHEDRIIRVRVELGYNHKKERHGEFMAKGHIEINGPDMIVTESTDDLYKSIDQMIQKLDRKLRRRARLLRVKRRHNSRGLDIPANLPQSYVA
ncbi:MAG: ribosomal subunit interface protein [Verrucomicrobia bacterium CG_4_10_14_3_um_filter_43_23]|nr:MAG: ribosomal subunit interface protein [Verrucomicrobia bacterium CG1_02_43_26]PIP59847.1 MAG: ribosomal subunit interface protein [Verrucomicrobia bacterium CG22_combo_CG10-13_8_21_14_all_43_17]PIX57859.1 MAG: ribosomal subunit interface protein [Verrucomicrobia bacterium CG_4_10_14_3_um_filter_43_23]PIY63064.1 MAG: ribosomal subunit interface protein [Verrucomicrobia bacterium CG_4_10_14_0_8_um_filter_43_34]PJA43688.1 MAG: ribosomal subunit interface protein [Verrucomicrobia bacterium CG